MSDRSPEDVSRESVLTIKELAAHLRCSIRTIENADLPTIYLGTRTRRYILGQVLDTLARRTYGQ